MSGKNLLGDDSLLAVAKDVCRIITVCAKNGVSEFRLGDIHLVFGAVDQPSIQPRMVQTKPLETKSISDEAEAQDRLEATKTYLDELLISDPLAYEKLLAGDLDVEGGT